jgi:hypothetical protein
MSQAIMAVTQYFQQSPQQEVEQAELTIPIARLTVDLVAEAEAKAAHLMQVAVAVELAV